MRITPGYAVSLDQMVFIDSRAVWLAIDDISDCRMDERNPLLALDWISHGEALVFQNQVFYWLLNRAGLKPVYPVNQPLPMN